MQKIVLADGDFSVEIWSLGACVNDIRMPARDGSVASVVLGYDNEEDRRSGQVYLGEICGPCANRIGSGGYVIDDTAYTPDLNDSGTATLHGGAHGWNVQDWEVTRADEASVTLELTWSDPDGGFPGPIHAEVAYRLDQWSLTHTVRASAQVPAILNVVSHPYFNLSGTGQPIGDHELQVDASRFLPIDGACLPLDDAPWSVDGTALDFRQPRLLADALATPDPQLLDHGGIDHALILDGPKAHLRRVAVLRHPGSGRELQILTDYPAFQVYTGQYLSDPRIAHPQGAVGPGSGIALETEEYPDAPRRPDFPSVLVRPGQTYTRTTVWRFRVQ